MSFILNYEYIISILLYSIGKTTGYRSSELAGLVEGSTLYIGGKEIEVISIYDMLTCKYTHNDIR